MTAFADPLQSMYSQAGLALVVGNVFLSQIGLPVPVAPTLIIAGAVAAAHVGWGAELLLIAVLVTLLADTCWYAAGRISGKRIMAMLCRVSLTPDLCVSETQLRFERWGPNALIVAKFVPGLATVAPPLAGALRMPAVRFLARSFVGAALWVTAYLACGALFASEIDRALPRLAELGGRAVLALAILLALYVAFKWMQRVRFHRTLRMARITAAELRRLMDGSPAPLVIDVRSNVARTIDPRAIPGARHVATDTVELHVRDLPRDRDIIVYCNCPNDATAARVAKLLAGHGIKRVRPLEGGLDGWAAAGFGFDKLPGSDPD